MNKIAKNLFKTSGYTKIDVAAYDNGFRCETTSHYINSILEVWQLAAASI